MNDILTRMNSPERAVRLSAAKELGHLIDEGKLKRTVSKETNNHIHTIYSFSPYSPSMAAYKAWEAGLAAAGSVDHESVTAGMEIVEACRYLGIGSTVGLEVRVHFTGTPLEGKKFNNPDTLNNAYIIIHGIPHQKINEVARFLEPINRARDIRIEAEVKRLNELLGNLGVDPLDYEKDVAAISETYDGGSITERHILYALSLKLIGRVGKGEAMISFLTETLELKLPALVSEWLLDDKNPHYAYDLLGVLKSGFMHRFFVQPDETECPFVGTVVDFANSISAIPAYSYLGDVGESPTGDKKAEHFEDDYLEELFPVVKKLGFKALAYMPPRNSIEQLKRVQVLASKWDLMEISGVDINSSRQAFNCPEILMDEFSHLIGTTWALIAHEHAATRDIKYGLFNPENPMAARPLSERLSIYGVAGEGMDPKNPDKVLDLIMVKERE
ncbi:MAG: PHP domain-containing protein [Spirochaetales bacterium]|nr:PHP domain-containing protein [Spirochaetales bacterium]